MGKRTDIIKIQYRYKRKEYYRKETVLIRLAHSIFHYPV